MFKQLVLVGGGHAHLAVLKQLARQSMADLRIILVTPATHQLYSGMLPGWLAGHYRLNECQIDLRPLAEAAGAEFVLAKVIGLDANDQSLLLDNDKTLPYDLLSLDIGSLTDLSGLEACGDRLLGIRPLEQFINRWPAILLEARKQADYSLAVVGGGAAGIELAFAIQYAFASYKTAAKVHLIAPQLLPNHAPSVIERIKVQLAKQQIRWHQAYAQGIPTGLELSNGDALAVDFVLAATQARPVSWLALSHLALDSRGYVRVNAYHQSLSHPTVFAAGDVSSREHPNFQRSGVHAVHAGPILAHNLVAIGQEQPLKAYQPKQHSLYLLATGAKHAIASWGHWSASGTWVWYWKHFIDTGFIRRHSRNLASK